MAKEEIKEKVEVGEEEMHDVPPIAVEEPKEVVQ
jgi:hypothetical protein